MNSKPKKTTYIKLCNRHRRQRLLIPLSKREELTKQPDRKRGGEKWLAFCCYLHVCLFFTFLAAAAPCSAECGVFWD